MKNLFLYIVSLFILVSITRGQLVQGFGSAVTGGSGRPVVHVTNLNATGPGSLNALIGSNRTIVFDVTGTILGFQKTVNNAVNMTIDASGLPFPGITLDNNNTGDCLSLDGPMCSNIIIKNIRVRNANNDGINIINGAHDIVLDHVSSRLNRDGNIDITSGAYNVTTQYCLIGPGNNDRFAGGMLIAYTPTRNISIHHNLFYTITPGQVGERNPLIHSNNEPPGNNLIADVRNNCIYRWGRNNGTGSGYGSAVCYNANANIVRNYYYSTVSENSATNTDDGYGNGGNGKAFIFDNFSGNGINANVANNHAEFIIPPAAQVQTQDPCTAAFMIKNNAGCRPLDSFDAAIINNVNLFLCPPIVTPVMWINFTFNKYKNQLEWSTAWEQNNDRYYIEESSDAVNWQTIGNVPSKGPGGNSDIILNYQFTL